MKKFNFKGVTAETWQRTLALVIALITQFAIILGKTDTEIDIDKWTVYISYAFTAFASIWSWWKNNSFTEKAQNADKLMRGEYGNGSKN